MQGTISSLNEHALLRRVQAGETAAFEVLYERHQARVYRYALRMSGSREIADDVVQEVFLGLIRGARGFDPEAGALTSYLYGMARNLLFRQFSPAAVDELDDETAGTDSNPLEGLELAEKVERVRQALASLPAHYREAVVLCEMEEMSYAEVAEVLGVAVGTVRSRLHRARAILVEKLSEERCRA